MVKRYRRGRRRVIKRRKLQVVKNRVANAKRTLGAMYAAGKAGVKAAGIYNRWKRRRTGSSSDSSGYAGYSPVNTLADYSKRYYRVGRRYSASKRGRKLVRKAVGYRKYGLRDYGAWNASNGQRFLVSRQPGALGTEIEQPVHLWDLTGVTQTILTAGTTAGDVVFPATYMVLKFSDETDSAAVKWQYYDPTSGLQNVPHTQGVLMTQADRSSNLYMTYTSGSGQNLLNTGFASESATGRDLLEDINVNMMCYGPTGQCTKWLIQLVQLKEDVTPGKQNTLATAFWQSMAKPYGYNPIERGNRYLQAKYMKVLKSIYFEQDAPESTEDHLKTRMRHVMLKYFANRVCNYQWGMESDKVAMDRMDQFENARVETNTENHNTTVHPNARIYLMVRALTTYLGPNANLDVSKTPTYDITIETVHKKLDT